MHVSEGSEISGSHPENVAVTPEPQVDPSVGDGAAEEDPVSETPRAAEVDPATAQDGAARATQLKHPPRFPGLLRALRTGRPVEGRITAVIKGGYEVKVGRARGFCPHSQIALEREEHPDRHLDQTYPFRVTQVRRGGEDIVLSRRALLEAARLDEASAVRATLIEGAVMRGRVHGTADFGAFVDLGAGVMGLVHVSELAHGRVRRAEDVVQAGQVVEVKVLKIDPDKGRIALSLRQAQADPWAGIAARFVCGQTYAGVVARHVEFGVFVELASGVEALASANELPPLAGSWSEILAPGTTREWFVLGVDERQRRISLTLPADGPPVTIETGAILRGRVQRIERFGVFIWLAPGRVGLMPRAWAADAGDDLRRRFTIGAEIEARVVECTDEGRRIRLAPPALELLEPPAAPQPAREPRREPRREPTQRAAEAPAHSAFGSILADKLRAALDR